MSDHPDPSGSTLSKFRLEALSDGVFAIAMTLLVLEVKVPDLPRHAPEAEVVAALRSQVPNLLSYFISFMLAGTFWFTQHLAFHFVRHATRALCWINLVFLMFVSLLPFSAALLGHQPASRIAFLVYYGNQFGVSFMLLLLWIYVLRGGLLEPHAEPGRVREFTVRIAGFTLAFGLASVLVLYEPLAGAAALVFAIAATRLLGKRMRSSTARA